MARRKANQRLTLLRNAIIAFVIVLIVGVGGYGLLYSTGVGSPGTWTEGEHYTLLEGTAPLRPGAPIPVAEYFSYGCIHCRNLDPLIEGWVDSAPDDVAFQRMPVSFGGEWDILARGYFALAATGALEANHERLFRGIHDQGKRFVSAAMLADFVDGHGVDRDGFLTAYNSPEVRRQAARAQRLARELNVTSVPTLIVADRYRIAVGDVGRAEALELVDYLLETIRADAAPAEPGAAPTEPVAARG